MSHNIKLSNVRFTDMGLLADVVKDVSGGRATLDMNAKTFRTYAGQPNVCDAAILMPGPHDIGLQKQGEAYTPVFDPYRMSDVLSVPGGVSKIGEAQREYALRVAEYEAAQNGMTTERLHNAQTGTITLEITEAA